MLLIGRQYLNRQSKGNVVHLTLGWISDRLLTASNTFQSKMKNEIGLEVCTNSCVGLARIFSTIPFQSSIIFHNHRDATKSQLGLEVAFLD